MFLPYTFVCFVCSISKVNESLCVRWKVVRFVMILTHEVVCSKVVKTYVSFTDEHVPHLVKLHCAQGLQLVSMVFKMSVLSGGRTEWLLQQSHILQFIVWPRWKITGGLQLRATLQSETSRKHQHFPVSHWEYVPCTMAFHLLQDKFCPASWLATMINKNRIGEISNSSDFCCPWTHDKHLQCWTWIWPEQWFHCSLRL